MKSVIEIMESEIKPLYFISVKVPQKNSEDGPEFATFVNETHTTVQFAVIGKPIIKTIGEPGRDLDHTIFGKSNLEDFMQSTFPNGSRSKEGLE